MRCTCFVTRATSLEKPVAERVFDQLRAPVQIELGHDARAICVHSLWADEEPLGDLQVREAARREAQDLALPWRERRLDAAVLVLLRREKEPNSGGREIGISGRNGAYRVDELLVCGALQNVSGCTQPDRLHDVPILGIH